MYVICFLLGSTQTVSAQKTGRNCQRLHSSHLGLLGNANVWVGSSPSLRPRLSLLRLLVASSYPWFQIKSWCRTTDLRRSHLKKYGSLSPREVRWNVHCFIHSSVIQRWGLVLLYKYCDIIVVVLSVGRFQNYVRHSDNIFHL